MSYYRSRQDMRPFIGVDWWVSTRTKYNEDGTVYRRPSNPGRLYTWFVLTPTGDRANRIMIEFLVGMIILSFILAF